MDQSFLLRLSNVPEASAMSLIPASAQLPAAPLIQIPLSALLVRLGRNQTLGFPTAKTPSQGNVSQIPELWLTITGAWVMLGMLRSSGIIVLIYPKRLEIRSLVYPALSRSCSKSSIHPIFAPDDGQWSSFIAILAKWKRLSRASSTS